MAPTFGMVTVSTDCLKKELDRKLVRMELYLSTGFDRFVDLQYSHCRLVANLSRTIERGFAANGIKEILKVSEVVRLV